MHQNSCKNGCEFAKQIHLMSYATKNADGTYSDADYLYKCSKIDRIISLDASVYELGCATYNYMRAEPACICTPQPEPEPEHVPEPIPTPVTVEPAVMVTGDLTFPAPAPTPVVIVEPIVPRVEPKFVPEPSVSAPPEPVATPIPEVKKVRKPRSKPAVTVTVPVVPIISDNSPIVSVVTDTPAVPVVVEPTEKKEE